jgi:hypothetical protein
MRKIDLGQLLTIVANLGVIAGIGFLAYEMRQNTIAISGATVQAIASQSQQTSFIGLEVPELQLAWQRAGRGLRYATPEDISNLAWWYSGVMRLVENRYRQAQLGTVNAAVVSQLGGFSDTYRQPFFGMYWEIHRHEYAEDFALWVDANLLPLVQDSVYLGPPDSLLPEALDALPRD